MENSDLIILESGKDLAQSQMRTPSISDPGHDLVKRQRLNAKIPVVAVPGPSAGITGLIASG